MSISAGTAAGRRKSTRDIKVKNTDGERILTNPRKRRCKVCQTPLTIYNLNDFCFAHLYKGLKVEYKKSEEKAYKQYQKNKRAVNLKRKGATNG